MFMVIDHINWNTVGGDAWGPLEEFVIESEKDLVPGYLDKLFPSKPRKKITYYVRYSRDGSKVHVPYDTHYIND